MATNVLCGEETEIMTRALRMLEKMQLTSDGIRAAYQIMQQKEAKGLLKILDPLNFRAFINQLGSTFTQWNRGSGGHGFNPLYEWRIQITSTGKNGFPGPAVASLPE